MAAQLMAYPFRFNARGEVALADDGSDEYYTGELAILVSTKPGERQSVPEYGMNDPTFMPEALLSLSGLVEMFGPPVIITDVRTTFGDEETLRVAVDFRQFDDRDELESSYIIPESEDA